MCPFMSLQDKFKPKINSLVGILRCKLTSNIRFPDLDIIN